MNTHFHKLSEKTKRVITLLLIVVLGVSSAAAGLVITRGSGISEAGADGAIEYRPPIGISALPVDGLLSLRPNNITAPTTPGILSAGADAVTYTGRAVIT